MPKTYRYATLDDVIDALNQGESIALNDVRPSLRASWIHVGYHGIGSGYLPDTDSHVYARNRRAIVDSHCDTCRMFDDSSRVPAGFRATLMRGGSARSADGRTLFEVDCVTVRDAVGG
jgi:hypothetical protein